MRGREFHKCTELLRIITRERCTVFQIAETMCIIRNCTFLELRMFFILIITLANNFYCAKCTTVEHGDAILYSVQIYRWTHKLYILFCV